MLGARQYWRSRWAEFSTWIRLVWILVVGTAAVGSLWMGAGIGSSWQLATVSALSYVVAPVGAGVLLMLAALRRRDPGFLGWMVIGAGVMLLGGGELVWTYYAHIGGGEVPYPGLADVLYVAAYPVIFAGVLLLPHVRAGRWERARLTLDSLAGTVAVTAIAWDFFLNDLVRLEPEAGFFENAVNLSYPIGDLILLIALIMLTTRRSKLQFDGRLLIIGAGIMLTAVADIWFLFQDQADTYVEGGRLDAVWLAGYCLFAVAALLVAGKPQLREQADRPNRLWPMVAPYTAVLVLFALTLVEPGENMTFLQIASGMVGVLIVIRQGVAIRENREVVEKQRNDLVASISHELRTPLTAMTGFTAILDQNPDLDRSERIEMLSIIDSQTRHLARIVGDLVEVARNQLEVTKLNVEEIEVSDLVDSAIAMLPYDVSQIRITPHIESGLTFRGDVDRLRQVLVNYLTNAGRYGNGVVEVHAKTINNRVLVEVDDNGVGIPKKYDQTIWERFERGAHTYMSDVQGSGLGLAITRQLVTAHRGQTGHHPSQRLGGTCFWFTLPAGDRLKESQQQPLAVLSGNVVLEDAGGGRPAQ
jgi:signal transduction histidine kinase